MYIFILKVVKSLLFILNKVEKTLPLRQQRVFHEKSHFIFANLFNKSKTWL